MKHQKTIAIIGAANKEAQMALKILLNADCHLLLLASDQAELRRIGKLLRNERPVAGVSLIDCIKDGCWEADAVVMAVEEEKEMEVADRIREVVTQKIVISMNIADTIPGDKVTKLFPYSNVVSAYTRQTEDGSWKLVLSAGTPQALKEADELLNSLSIRHSLAA